MASVDHPWLSPKNFFPASLYLILLGALSGALLELAKEWVPLSWLTVAMVVVAVAGGYRLVGRLRRVLLAATEVVRVIEHEEPPGAKALVTFVSQGPGSTSALQAASYHAGLGALQHLWLVTTRTAEPGATAVAAEVGKQFPSVRVHEVHFLDDKDNIREAKRVVEHLRQTAINEFGIPEADLVCDFTGLTKNASAGMILACAPKTARLQYMVPDKVTADGRADPTSGSHPREVSIQYEVIEQE